MTPTHYYVVEVVLPWSSAHVDGKPNILVGMPYVLLRTRRTSRHCTAGVKSVE